MGHVPLIANRVIGLGGQAAATVVVAVLSLRLAVSPLLLPTVELFAVRQWTRPLVGALKPTLAQSIANWATGAAGVTAARVVALPMAVVLSPALPATGGVSALSRFPPNLEEPRAVIPATMMPRVLIHPVL